MILRVLIFMVWILFLCNIQAQQIIVDKNKPERKEWFQSLAFGMFIHWSIDVQLGGIISHNVAASSKEYQNRYFNELPEYFNPKRFDPEEWAKLASLAGMKYMVFTAKHHNGFCMWDTKTVPFKITNTPYGQDILKEILDAFRKQGIAVGLYYSPDDFYLNYIQGKPASRNLPEANPNNNSDMWKIEKEQITELLTNYGKIDIFFIDEYYDYVNTLVADYCWGIDPDLLITRGGMETPEQTLPDKAIPPPWEACFTMGRHWGYVAGEDLKEGHEIISKFIEIRAKGGNLLLNVSPDSHGTIPNGQEAILREIGLWYMVNRQAVENVIPFDVTSELIASNWWFDKPEERIWFTRSKVKNIVYAFVPSEKWGIGDYRTYFVRSLKGTHNTSVTLLGQHDSVMEYNMDVSSQPVISVVEEGIFINAVRSQRMNKYWQSPVVLRIENVSYNKKGTMSE